MLLADLPADNPVQPVSPEDSTLCQYRHSIDHHPTHVNGIIILVLCVHRLGMCYDVPHMSPNPQTVPPQSFPLIQEFQNFECCIGLDFCCVFVPLAEPSMKRLLEFARDSV